MAENKLDNSKLEKAAEEFAKDRQKEKYAGIMELLERSVVLVPTLAPQGLDSTAQKMMQEGKQVPVPKDAKIMPCLLRRENGGQVLPIFTSIRQIPKDKKSPAVLAMPFFYCVSMVMGNQEKVEAIVMNPFSHNVVLPKGILEVAEKRRNALQQQTKTIRMTEKQFKEWVHNRVALYLLPKYLFEHKEDGLKSLQKEEGDFIIQFYREAYPEGKKDSVAAAPDDFSVMTLNLTDNMQMTRVDMPAETAKKGMCYRVYAVWLRDAEELRYYTFEKTEEGNYIGRVMPDGKHELIEAAPDNGTEIEAVMNMAGREA